MRTFNIHKGVKGVVFAYNKGRTNKIDNEQSKVVEFRLKVLDHARMFGIRSTIDAFSVSERTVKYWRSRLRKKNGNPNALGKTSTRPIHLSKPKYSQALYEYIFNIKKEGPVLGKEKIAHLIFKDLHTRVSPSTVQRIVIRLRKEGKLPEKVRYSYYAKQDKLRVRKVRKTKPKLRRGGYAPKGPGDVVQVDTVELRIRGRKFFVSTGIDVFNRKAFAKVSHHHSSLEAKEFLMMLPQYLGYPVVHIQTDNGSEFKKYFDSACEELKILHFWNHPRTPKENANVERFNRTIQEEWVKENMHLFYLKDIQEIQDSLTTYLTWYNTRRPHWSLGLMTPSEYGGRG